MGIWALSALCNGYTLHTRSLEQTDTQEMRMKAQRQAFSTLTSQRVDAGPESRPLPSRGALDPAQLGGCCWLPRSTEYGLPGQAQPL